MSDDARNEARLAMLEQMVAAGSPDPFHHYARAMALRSLRRLDEAHAAFAEVLARFPEYVPSYLMAGQVAEERGDEDAARELFTRGLAAAKAASDGHALGELQAALDEL